MQLDLTAKHALVCGASQGIGKAIAWELALLGANVTLLARSADSLRELAQNLPRPHGAQQHQWRSVDMLATALLQAAATDIAANNPVHILINNTGGPPGGATYAADPAMFEAAFRQHLLAGQALVQALLPGMRSEGYGRIVNIISTSVKEPLAGLGVSNTVRGAVANWAKSLAGELAGDGITVNNVLPGYTRTQRLISRIQDGALAMGHTEEEVERDMLRSVPAGRFGEAHEVAAVAAFLCTPAASYVNGVNIPVDGGRTRSL